MGVEGLCVHFINSKLKYHCRFSIFGSIKAHVLWCIEHDYLVININISTIFP